MIIKTTDFVLDAYIPNRDDAPNSDIIGNEPELQGFIDVHEKEVLVQLLGFNLYTELMDQFDVNGDWNIVVDQKWKDLVDGKDAYRGMKDLLVGYVFYKFIESDDSHYSTIGVQKENSENAERFDSRPKAVQLYRKFYEQAIGGFYQDQSYIKPSIWGNLNVVMWSGGYGSNFISLYEYLSMNSIDFTDWMPTNFKNINNFDV
ncbi:MAG: hypothetical protein ABFS35_18855 [Bacteroidota bacterium]